MTHIRVPRGFAILLLSFLLLAGSLAWAQWEFGGQFGGRRQQRPDRSEYPTWEVAAGFPQDVFTFARIEFRSRRGGWDNDFPDCDWNFSFRLQQLTSLQVDPNGKVIGLSDPELFDYPFIYMSNVQNMVVEEDEVAGLRRYLEGGGFLMADDFWTPAAWRHVSREMSRVLPNRKPRELALDHPIFHIVYDLKEKPQVPSIFAWRQGDRFEYWNGDPEGDEEPHFWGYFDDHDRLMALFCQNNDIGDGWEREGEDKEYFREFSEKCSYPLGINILTYVMTH